MPRSANVCPRNRVRYTHEHGEVSREGRPGHPAKSVESAVEEFDRLGRQKFLEKHGFGQAINYFLRPDGRLYDSKAICGVAYGKENPADGPLKRWQFSAGEKTVERH